MMPATANTSKTSKPCRKRSRRFSRSRCHEPKRSTHDEKRLAPVWHDFMATPVIGSVNVGLLFGLGQFVTTFVITMLYVRYANRRLDPLAEKIRTELDGGDER